MHYIKHSHTILKRKKYSNIKQVSKQTPLSFTIQNLVNSICIYGTNVYMIEYNMRKRAQEKLNKVTRTEFR